MASIARGMSRSSSDVTRILLIALFAVVATPPARAQAPDYHGKLTIGTYEAAGEPSVDVNIRYSLQDWTGWAGYYAVRDGTSQGRIGIEYDLHRRRLFLVPSLQAASHGFLGGSVYSEIGGRIYVVAGASRTNLQPYVDLTFDPNESWQLGAGAHIGRADSIALFSIWDNRLHTGQQNTHTVLRHHFGASQRLTAGASYKSGHGDDGTFVRGGAVTIEYDLGRWFGKVSGDRHVNFSPDTMWRLGGGLRF